MITIGIIMGILCIIFGIIVVVQALPPTRDVSGHKVCDTGRWMELIAGFLSIALGIASLQFPFIGFVVFFVVLVICLWASM